ncbi:hypothetical protein ACI65C_013865 [Semiaphis heraclei]
MRYKRKAQLKVIANDSKQRKLNFSVRPSASASSNDDVMLIEYNFKVSLLPLPIEKEYSLVKDIEKSVLPVKIEKESERKLVKNSESECITLNHKIVPGHGNIFHDISISKNYSPVQPESVKFPVTNGRRFNTKYYKEFEWLEYSVSKDSLFCFSTESVDDTVPSTSNVLQDDDIMATLETEKTAPSPPVVSPVIEPSLKCLDSKSNIPSNNIEEYYKKSIFIPYLDDLMMALNERFIPHNETITSLQYVLPSNVVDKPFSYLKKAVEFYENDLPGLNDVIEAEYEIRQAKWKNIEDNLKPTSAIEALILLTVNFEDVKYFKMFSLFKKHKNVNLDDPSVSCSSGTSKNDIGVNDLGTLSTGPRRPVLAFCTKVNGHFFSKNHLTNVEKMNSYKKTKETGSVFLAK